MGDTMKMHENIKGRMQYLDNSNIIFGAISIIFGVICLIVLSRIEAKLKSMNTELQHVANNLKNDVDFRELTDQVVKDFIEEKKDECYVMEYSPTSNPLKKDVPHHSKKVSRSKQQN